jgi:hypothetical protein
MASGIVIDKTTSLPIEGAKVYFYDQPNTFSYTDSLGSYSIHYVKWGLGCYAKDNKKVIVEKKAYKKSNAAPARKTIELIQDSIKPK